MNHAMTQHNISSLYFLLKIENRKYLLDDFIHTFADLSQLHFKGLNKTKSIYDTTFIEKPRVIKGKINFLIENLI